MAEWTGTPGVVGVRIMLTAQPNFEADDPGLNRHTCCRRPSRRSGERHVFDQTAAFARTGPPPSKHPGGD